MNDVACYDCGSLNTDCPCTDAPSFGQTFEPGYDHYCGGETVASALCVCEVSLEFQSACDDDHVMPHFSNACDRGGCSGCM